MLRVALIGTGLIATQKHLPAWQRIGDIARIVAVCELDRARGERIAREFSIPSVYADVGEMLTAERPDLVDVCTPPRTHAPLALQALRSGAHVLVEKPMAVSVEECDQMIACAEETGKSLCVAHSDLFYPSFMGIKSTVERGGIGEFRGMRIFLSTPVDYITEKPDHWANALPGGVIGETGPHVVYMTLAFINPIQRVLVHGQKQLPVFPWSPYEDYRLILAGERAVCDVTLTYATNQWAATVEVWGNRGMIAADLESQSLVRIDRTALTPRSVGLSTLSTAAQMSGRMLCAGTKRALGRLETTHGMLIRALCESILRGAPPPVTAQEGRESIRVMDSIVEQLKAAS